jgi:hypothetical protein
VAGDSLSDIHMADGYECQTSLSVGFLNANEEENLAKYMVCWFHSSSCR